MNVKVCGNHSVIVICQPYSFNVLQLTRRLPLPQLLIMARASAQNGIQAQLTAEQDGELHVQLHALDLDKISTNNADPSEICPVCKSNKYLNKDLRFLVNPECYHKMCESCVDRIFSQGPAPCPIARCARTLRKQRFRRPKFEDLAIEREVDIRRRIDSM